MEPLSWRPLLRKEAQANPEFGLKVAMWMEYGYLHAQEKLQKEMKATVSIQSLRNFRKWWDLRMAFQNAEEQTETYEEKLREAHPEATEVEIKQSGQEYFEQLAAERGNVKEFCELQHLRLAKLAEERRARLEEAKLKLETRKVALLEEKKKKEKKRGGGLTAETLAEIEEAAKLL